MKIIITVKNNSTAETFTYDCADIMKARIAVDYLTMNTPYLWFLEIVVE